RRERDVGPPIRRTGAVGIDTEVASLRSVPVRVDVALPQVSDRCDGVTEVLPVVVDGGGRIVRLGGGVLHRVQRRVVDHVWIRPTDRLAGEHVRTPGLDAVVVCGDRIELRAGRAIRGRIRRGPGLEEVRGADQEVALATAIHVTDLHRGGRGHIVRSVLTRG